MIPNYVPQHLNTQWSTAFHTAVTQGHTQEFATIFANNFLLQTTPVVEPVKRTKDTLVPITFTIQAEQLISRTEDGEEYVTAILSDNQPYVVPTTFGAKIETFSLSVLQKFADTINRNMPVGDVDHLFYDSVLSKNLTDEQIKRALEQKPGIAKAVRAIVDNGKLYIRLLLDKRYKKVVEKAKGLSLEAFVSKDAQGTVHDGTLLGFTFAVNQTPVNQRAVLIA